MTTMTPAPSIRTATEADARALADLGRRTFIDTFGSENDADDLAAFLEATYGEDIQRKELADPHLTCFLAEGGALPAGFALLRQGRPSALVADPTALELQRLYVDRPWHGTGLAQALMAASIRHARSLGATSLFLGVWERNTKALRFYAAQGFVPVGQQDFMLGSDRQTDVVMLRRVDHPRDA